MPELTVTLRQLKNDGSSEPFTGFTEEQIKRFSERIGHTLSLYYTQHPDEFEKID